MRRGSRGNGTWYPRHICVLVMLLVLMCRIYSAWRVIHAVLLWLVVVIAFANVGCMCIPIVGMGIPHGRIYGRQ